MRQNPYLVNMVDSTGSAWYGQGLLALKLLIIDPRIDLIVTRVIVKRFIEFILYLLIKFLLSLRYRIKIKGKEHLNAKALDKPGGILFLANHPAEVDPLILQTSLWYPFKPHPVAIDYLFRKPLIRELLDFVGALPIPNFDSSSNSYKRREIEKTYEHICSYLKRKENLLIYPSGSLKVGPEEVIGGASGVHTILERQPGANVVLVRTTGLWGSTFSRAPTGKTPDIAKSFFFGFKVLLKNLIFFAPRREVLVEFEPAPVDFPWRADRREFNRYLERWFNVRGPEPLKLVSFSRFHKVFPKIKEKAEREEIALEDVPEEIKEQVLDEITKLTRTQVAQITADTHLAQDLGLDSLDVAQLVVSLKDRFGIDSLHSSDLTTVGSVFAFAAKNRVGQREEEEQPKKVGIWQKEEGRPKAFYPDCQTIPETFLKTCDRMKGYIACVDAIAGPVSYKKLKMGALLFAEAIKKMPGERIGIMMPASVAVNAIILATLLAGKIPVMINWTLGGRNLRSVVEQAQIEVALSSWNFLDRLDNVELNGVDDKILLLEELRRKFSLKDKLKALWLSRKKASSLLKKLNLLKIKPHDPAVILFTSGTESFPKGVPLSHQNLITNQRGAYEMGNVWPDDVLLGSLPPFHSFGFSVTGLLPLMLGLRVAYSPNPTDGKRIAESIARWDITLLCLAPTFLKNLFRAATSEQLGTLRLIVAGAEKMAAELYEKLAALNSKALLIEGYGITECAPILTLNPPTKPVCGVGLPLPGVEIMIIHPETHHPLKEGSQGLILARGPNVFAGYLDPQLPSPFLEAAGKKWYQTGDLGFLNQNGYLTLSGRMKRFVKIGGEMVSLAAIEETLQQTGLKKGWKLDPELPSLAVSALEQEGKKSEIHLFTTFATTLDEVNQALRESGMSNIIKIRSHQQIPFIPILGSGKVDYRRLAAKVGTGD